MKRIIFFSMIFTSIFSQEFPINSGVRFLLTDYDVVTYSLSGAVYASFNRSTFITQNPALGYLIQSPSFFTFYSRKTLGAHDVRFQLFSPLKVLALSLDFYGEFVDPEDRMNEEGNKTGTFFSSSFALQSSISAMIYSNLYGGIGLKLISQNIGDYRGIGFSSDVGVFYRVGRTGLNVGGVFKELGFGPAFNGGERVSLPSRLGLGLSYSPGNKGIFTLSLAYDFYLKDNINKIKFGAEYIFYRILTLRFGLAYTRIVSDDMDISILKPSGGFGITAGRLNIDLGISPNNLEGAIVGVNLLYTIPQKQEIVSFDTTGLSEKEKMTSMNFYNNALSRAVRGDYEGAVELLDIALIWDPDNMKAAEKMGEFKAKLKEQEVSRLLEAGKKFYNEKKYLEALLVFEKASKLDPSNEEITKYIILSKTGLEKSLAQDSTVSLLLKEGNDFYIKGNYGDALRKWLEALSNGADSSVVNGYIKNLKERLTSYLNEKVQNIEILIKGDRLTRASMEISKVESKLNSIASVQGLPSELSILISDARKKISDFRSDINEKLFSLNRLGIDNYKKGNYRTAEKYFRKVLSIDSTNTTARTYINRISQKMKSSKKDVTDLYMRGVLAYTSGDYKLAIYYWKEVLKINPQHANAKKNIERAREKLKSIGG